MVFSYSCYDNYFFDIDIDLIFIFVGVLFMIIGEKYYCRKFEGEEGFLFFLEK